MPKHSERVQKLLKRSAKFRGRIVKALMKEDENADLVALTALLDKVDEEIVRLGRGRARKKR